MSKIDVVHKVHAHIPSLPAGEHLWCYVSMFRVVDPESPYVIADQENLVTIEGPGCFYCEEPYRPGMKTTRCKAKR